MEIFLPDQKVPDTSLKTEVWTSGWLCRSGLRPSKRISDRFLSRQDKQEILEMDTSDFNDNFYSFDFLCLKFRISSVHNLRIQKNEKQAKLSVAWRNQ